jgi:hypothetical protein
MTYYDMDELISIFKKYPTIFPKGYFAYLKGNLNKFITNNQLIYEQGVILTWNDYKRATTLSDNFATKKGDYIIHQIVSSEQGNGNASKVLTQFLNSIGANKSVWLSVREDNVRAINFYKRHDFEVVGEKSWSSDKIKGYIMCKII